MQNITIEMSWDEIRIAAIEIMRDKYNTLSAARYTKYFLLCDGFGRIDENFAKTKIEWDWSHVRDSTHRALLNLVVTNLNDLSMRQGTRVNVRPVGVMPDDGIERGFVTLDLSEAI